MRLMKLSRASARSSRRGSGLSICMACTLALGGAAVAQTEHSALPKGFDSTTWASRSAGQYDVRPSITYRTVDGVQVKLDVFRRKDIKTPVPTMISIHGGGWGGGTRDGLLFMIMPWFEMGWNVVNIDYRVTPIAKAPAAVEDSLCALRWVASNAERFGFDLNRVVLNGDSAGGHLSLLAGMIPDDAAFDRSCPSAAPAPKIAAIINWYGIADVNGLIDGPNLRPFAKAWIGDVSDPHDLAKKVSPMTYVRPGLPPVLTIHGDADPQVPYSQSVALNAALLKAGVRSEFITVPGGDHGNFSMAQYEGLYSKMWAFLNKL